MATPAVHTQKDWWGHRKPVNFIKIVATRSVRTDARLHLYRSGFHTEVPCNWHTHATCCSGPIWLTWHMREIIKCCSSNGFHTSIHTHAHTSIIREPVYTPEHTCKCTHASKQQAVITFTVRTLKNNPFRAHRSHDTRLSSLARDPTGISVSLYFFEYAMCSCFSFSTLQVLHSRFLGDFMSSPGLVKSDPGSNGSLRQTLCPNVNVLKNGWDLKHRPWGQEFCLWLKESCFLLYGWKS